MKKRIPRGMRFFVFRRYVLDYDVYMVVKSKQPISKSTKPLSVRVAPETENKLQRLAEATDRPKSWHMEQAIEAYLQEQSWQISKIEQGIKELDRGMGIPHHEVTTALQGYIKSKRRKRA
jgi:predicted transcriptional regulator